MKIMGLSPPYQFAALTTHNLRFFRSCYFLFCGHCLVLQERNKSVYLYVLPVVYAIEQITFLSLNILKFRLTEQKFATLIFKYYSCLFQGEYDIENNLEGCSLHS